MYLVLTSHAIVGKSFTEFIADNEEHRFWVANILRTHNKDYKFFSNNHKKTKKY